jgi:FtsZ-binding cell division protein ZapB
MNSQALAQSAQHLAGPIAVQVMGNMQMQLIEAQAANQVLSQEVLRLEANTATLEQENASLKDALSQENASLKDAQTK